MRAITYRAELLACVVHCGCRLLPTLGVSLEATGREIALHAGLTRMGEGEVLALIRAGALAGWELELAPSVLRFRRRASEADWSTVPLPRGRIVAIASMVRCDRVAPPAPWSLSADLSFRLGEVAEVSPSIDARGALGAWLVPDQVAELVEEARRRPVPVRSWVEVSVPCPACEASVHVLTGCRQPVDLEIDAPPVLSASDYWLCDEGHAGAVRLAGGRAVLGDPIGAGERTTTRHQVEECAALGDAAPLAADRRVAPLGVR